MANSSVKTDLEAYLYHTFGDRASNDASAQAKGDSDVGVLDKSSIQAIKEYEITKSGKSGLTDMPGCPQTGFESIFNDYHLVVVHKKDKDYGSSEKDESNRASFRKHTISELIENPEGAVIYKPGDFVYCARHGMPINRMITLRRFGYPVTNNIYDKEVQPEPDIARMVTYFDENTNPISELINLAWKMNWKPLTASFEDASGGMIGDQRGIDGVMGSMMKYIDPAMARQQVANPNQLNYDPTRDQNKVFGPVDSIAKVTIRDVGLETDIKFEITFDYELRSINGVNQKYAFIDLLSNILACTYNNGKFWGGTRFWVGKRPSTMAMQLRKYQPKDIDDAFMKGRDVLHKLMKNFNSMDSAVQTLKNIANNALNVALGKLLDQIGRPSMFVMNSLLKNEPTGEWHLMIGNPSNPIISIGNLIITNTQFKFDTNSIGFDDLPTKFSVTVSLEQAMPLDKSGLESIFNFATGRTYWKPSSIKIRSNDKLATRSGYFGDYSSSAVQNNVSVAFDFVRDEPKTQSDSAGGSAAKSNTVRRPNASSVSMNTKNLEPVAFNEMSSDLKSAFSPYGK